MNSVYRGLPEEPYGLSKLAALVEDGPDTNLKLTVL